ncbi:2TM domain-containing protein [Flavobacterium ponti]|uniref:2TM domain-containing protein n=1 Tax=Flavobacterium ponti TaxID=665133 RepID=A0ABV9P520_9FLAO
MKININKMSLEDRIQRRMERRGYSDPSSSNPDEIKYKEAVRRVKRIKGFYTHALIYVVINTMIVIINVQNLGEGESYFQWHNFITAFFWGIGLLAHGLSVFLPGMILGSDWEERKIRELMEKEQSNRSKWK